MFRGRPFGIIFLSFNGHVGTGLHIICSSGFQSIEGNGVVLFPLTVMVFAFFNLEFVA